MSTFAHTNGHGYQDDSSVAGSSKGQNATNGYSNEQLTAVAEPDHHTQAALSHGSRLIPHLYESGFQRGNYSDQAVRVGNAVFKLHGIILSRSPYLVHLMSTSPYQGIVYIPLEQYSGVTLEAISIALGWLYSYDALAQLTYANARATLAAACLLGGMEDLCAHALAVCRESINVETISDWLSWIDALHGPAAPSTPSTSSVSTPISATPPPAQEIPMSTVYGPYAQILRDDVFDFLTATLPTQLQAAADEGGEEPTEVLLGVFATASFETFKSAIESPKFIIGSGDHDRFRFAKAAIARRKEFVGRDVEETVVLAVGEGRSNVHVTRKTRRKTRPLWKVTK